MLSEETEYRISEAIFYRLYDDITVVRNTDNATFQIYNNTVKFILDEFHDYTKVDIAIKNLTDEFHFEGDLDGVQKTLSNFFEELENNGVLIRKRVFADDNNCLSSQVYRKLLKEGQLHRVLFELTYLCQERCRYCYCVEDKPSKTELTTNEVKRVLDELSDMNVFEIAFTGGDPFVRSDFLEILRYAKSKNFVTSVFTNGQAITDSDFISLKDLHLKDSSFTLYSHIAEKHDGFTRVKGSFSKTVACIKKCRLLGLNVNLKVPAINYNIMDLPSIIALASELGTSIQIGTSISPANDGAMTPTQYRLNTVEERAYVARIIQEAFTPVSSEQVVNSHYERNDYVCDAGVGSISINPFGDVFACSSLQICCGNVRAEPIEKIWQSSSQLSAIRNYKTSDIVGCEDCNYTNQCHFCPGIALLETNEPLRKYEDACLATQASLYDLEGRW